MGCENEQKNKKTENIHTEENPQCKADEIFFWRAWQKPQAAGKGIQWCLRSCCPRYGEKTIKEI